VPQASRQFIHDGIELIQAVGMPMRKYGKVTVREGLRRAAAARHRLEAQHARRDTREWVVKRRERTKHLIELGGLVVKSGLVELVNDDRAVLYGAFLELAFMLQGKDREQTLALWRRSGGRAFKGGRAAGRQAEITNPEE
jgi:hypothetical protein